MDIQLPCGSGIELVLDIDVTAAALQEIDSALRARRSAVLDVPDAGGPLTEAGVRGPFRRTYLPRRRLVVAGIGPVAVQLARLAKTGGFDVAIASPDERTRSAVEGSSVRCLAIAPSSGAASLDLDERTAVVLAFHDHEWEADLLPAVLQSDAFYIGAMGSGRTHRQRLERMRAQGFRSASLARIHGPAGVSAHARGAVDIAVSILAEIVSEEAQIVKRIGMLTGVRPETARRAASGAASTRERDERAASASGHGLPFHP